MDAVEIILLVVLVLLVAALFVLALAEASLLQVRPSAAEVAAEEGDRRAAGLVRLLDDLPRVLNAVLLAVLLVQVVAATIAGVLAQEWFGGSGVTIATVVVTFVLFIYGEAIPKTLAVQEPLKTARRLERPVRVLSTVFRPIVSVLLRIAAAQTGRDLAYEGGEVSEAELRLLADDAAEAGLIDESDAELIERSFVFGDLLVEQILIPRHDIVGVDVSAPVDEALTAAIAAGHRRLLVYEDDLDRVVGFVRLRDLAEDVRTDPGGTMRGRVRPVLEVAPTLAVAELLRRMQQVHCHMAVVRGDDRRTEGLVTIEDVVEELVGTIDDV